MIAALSAPYLLSATAPESCSALGMGLEGGNRFLQRLAVPPDGSPSACEASAGASRTGADQRDRQLTISQ